MDFSARTRLERQDKEDERLVRSNPPSKPPRRDLRRERVRTEDDGETEDPSETKDRSHNYKNVGGSLLERVVRRAAQDRIKAKNRETGEVVNISPETLKTEPGKYEPVGEGEESKEEQPKPPESDPSKPEKQPGQADRDAFYQKAGDALRALAQSNPRLESRLKDFSNPQSELYNMAEGNPDFLAEKLLGPNLPEGVRTLGDVREALKMATPPAKPKKKKKAPEAAPAESPPESKPSEPTATQPQAEAPAEPQAEAPPSEPEVEKPKAKKPKKPSVEEPTTPTPEPTETQKAGIPEPQRKPANAGEKEAALSMLVSTFPPHISSELIAKNYHPDDIRTLVSNYTAAKQGLGKRDIGELSEKVSSFFQTDPSKVAPPTKGKNAAGETVSFDKLTPEEQGEATRQHQLQIAAMSLAAHEAVTNQLTDKGSLTNRERVPRPLASLLSSMLLSGSKVDPQKAATDTFDTTIRSSMSSKISDGAIQKLLQQVSKNPAAHAAAKAYLQANDYTLAKAKFLKSGDAITEWQNPNRILRGLKETGRFFDQRNALYGESTQHPASALFRTRLLNRLTALDPKKASKVTAKLPDLEEAEYKVHHKAWEAAYRKWSKENEAHQKAVEAFMQNPKGTPPGEFAKPEPLEPKKPASRPDPNQGAEMWNAVFEPKGEEKKPSLALDEKEQAQVAAQVDQAWENSQKKTASSLVIGDIAASPFGVEFQTAGDLEVKVNNSLEFRFNAAKVDLFNGALGNVGFTYPPRTVMGSASKTGVYHGVDPYAYGPPAYPGWLQPHQRDLGVLDFKLILGEARNWLKSPLLSVAVEGMLPEAKLQAALDLAIYDSPYNRAINPTLYSQLLEDLSGKDATPKSAGHSYDVDQMTLLVYGPHPGVNVDVKEDIYTAYFPYKDDEGKDRDDGHASIRDIRMGPSPTRLQEKEFVQETVVVVDFPKGAEKAALAAIQKALKSRKLKVEKTTPNHKPELRKKASDDTFTFTPSPSDPTGGHAPMKASTEIRKFAAIAATSNPKLAFEMVSFADRLAEEEKKMPPWLEKKVEGEGDKKEEKKEASSAFVNLRSLIIKQAAAVDPSARGPWLPVLQALKTLG